jgi:hypothetical protein
MWVEQHEQLLKKWGVQAQYMHLMYEKAAANYRMKDQLIGIPIIVMGTITTSAIFIQIDDCSKYSQLTTGILSLFCTLCTAIHKFVGYNELTGLFSNAAQAYSDVVLDIQEQLARPRQDRLPVYDFINRIKISMRHLMTLPNIPSKILNQYLNDVEKQSALMGIPINSSPTSDFVISISEEHKELCEKTDNSPRTDSEFHDNLLKYNQAIVSSRTMTRRPSKNLE